MPQGAEQRSSETQTKHRALRSPSEERKKLLKQVEELRSLFKALDTDTWHILASVKFAPRLPHGSVANTQDGSGRISKAEFINAMKDVTWNMVV